MARSVLTDAFLLERRLPLQLDGEPLDPLIVGAFVASGAASADGGFSKFADV